MANGAIYIIQSPVLDFIMENPKINDFSTEVIPNFFGKIVTWFNQGTHRDIGSIDELRNAQFDKIISPDWGNDDEWQKKFLKMDIHNLINTIN